MVPVDAVHQLINTLISPCTSGGPQSMVFFERSLEERNARLRLENDLRGALRQGQLNCTTSRWSISRQVSAGAEALLRWNHPPWYDWADRFIPAAEHIGATNEIGEWVMRWPEPTRSAGPPI